MGLVEILHDHGGGKGHGDTSRHMQTVAKKGSYRDSSPLRLGLMAAADGLVGLPGLGFLSSSGGSAGFFHTWKGHLTPAKLSYHSVYIGKYVHGFSGVVCTTGVPSSPV